MTSRSAGLSHTKKNTFLEQITLYLSHIAEFGSGESCRYLLVIGKYPDRNNNEVEASSLV